MERIVDLKQSRQAYYAMADWTVQTDHLTLPKCARKSSGAGTTARSLQAGDVPSYDKELVCDVVTATERYPSLWGGGCCPAWASA